jgi:hypothetical protein
VFLGALAYFLLVKGPREYVVPIDAPETEPAPEAESDVSQVDVSSTAAEAAKAPKAYQVVSEERFRAYQRTGILPPVAAAAEPVAADEPATEPQPTGDAPASSSARTTTDER